MSDQKLVSKYNVPGPRYTSYPTVPYWQGESFSVDDWKKTLKRSFEASNDQEGISIYIHLPFCEQMCTFCGCHKRITKRHEVERPYLDALLKEWALYLALLPEKPNVKELHLGGGTPTFFSPENLSYLLEQLLAGANIAENPEFSFEGHPNNTSREHLKALYDLGFRRVSFGVQDYDFRVQVAINRIQPFERVEEVTRWARELGYTSVSHDLVFGLPFQTLEGVEDMIQKTRSLKPDRISFYSYAHVPWIKGLGQRGFKDEDLPPPAVKRQMYEKGKALFEMLDYAEVGMDHFSLKGDDLYKAIAQKTLHRNFMGYTPSKTEVMIGLGVSSISDSWYSFAQNIKKIEAYYAALEKGEFPIYRGHLLEAEDLVIRQHILNIMCRMETSWETTELQFSEIDAVLADLSEMVNDGLVQLKGNRLQVTEKGRPYVRNVCMSFDLLLRRKKPEQRLFSMTI